MSAVVTQSNCQCYDIVVSIIACEGCVYTIRESVLCRAHLENCELTDCRETVAVSNFQLRRPGLKAGAFSAFKIQENLSRLLSAQRLFSYIPSKQKSENM